MACGLNSKLWTTNSNARLPLTCISIRMRWHTQRHTLRHWRSRQQQLTSRFCTRWANEIISRPYNTNKRFRWVVAENYIYSLMINIKQDVDMWPMCDWIRRRRCVCVCPQKKKPKMEFALKPRRCKIYTILPVAPKWLPHLMLCIVRQ